jgi:hypothetical protein
MGDPEEKFTLDLNDFLPIKSNNSSHFDLILNSLPFGISVQSSDRIVLYENSKAIELIGSFNLKHCFTRWDHIPNEGTAICTDCPATISLIDTKPHRIFRKTLKKDMTELFLEIQVIPIFEKDGKVKTFIEILNDVSKDETTRVLTEKPIDEILNSLNFSLSKYGLIGGEILLNDDLKFFLSDKTSEYIQKLTMFTYVGVFQNNFEQEGLFGPLPVLDIPLKSMMVYSFRMKSESTDKRKKNTEPCLLLIFFDRSYYFIFEKRESILEFLNKRLQLQELNDLTGKWFINFKNDFKNLIDRNIHEIRQK